MRHRRQREPRRSGGSARQALGDRKLNYLGFSYGTLIGATYVNLFPRNARAIVLDGNVDPELRTTNGLEYERQHAEGFELVLDRFLSLCAAAGPDCAFGQGDPRAKFTQIRERLRTGPITLPDGWQVSLDSFTGIVGSLLYRSSSLESLASAEPLTCATWPVAHPAAYRGPWNRTTANPVLLFANYHDPATRYEFGQRMARELGNARLVSVDTIGHTILGQGSACADAIAAGYAGQTSNHSPCGDLLVRVRGE